MMHYVFICASTSGKQRYSVIGQSIEQANLEVKSFFKHDSNFHIKQVDQHSKYKGKGK